MKLFFHGRLKDDDFVEFSPFSHFGTRVAAINRIKEKKREPGNKGIPQLITVSIAHGLTGESINLKEDWGANTPLALSRGLSEYYNDINRSYEHKIFEDIRVKLIDEKRCGDYFTEESKRKFYEQGFKLIKIELDKLKIKAIYYDNKVEDESVSVCVVEPNIIKILEKNEINL
ncbi:hypothetical protein [Proteus terrae]|uniref:Uncharacterized protein n=1 Tax=Proteus terrae subsp. cibarius TaxID=626774 RepID=A0A8I0WRM6_9GAMM|nr:hypothetical protein [Proteus terrae]MBG2915157.1 hypothetical protein [Proteus terrae subsp. cibarius]